MEKKKAFFLLNPIDEAENSNQELSQVNQPCTVSSLIVHRQPKNEKKKAEKNDPPKLDNREPSK